MRLHELQPDKSYISSSGDEVVVNSNGDVRRISTRGEYLPIGSLPTNISFKENKFTDKVIELSSCISSAAEKVTDPHNRKVLLVRCDDSFTDFKFNLKIGYLRLSIKVNARVYDSGRTEILSVVE